MDKFPLLWKEKAVGELTAEREALYTCFSACCTLTERQRAILKAGGLLNYTKENGK